MIHRILIFTWLSFAWSCTLKDFDKSLETGKNFSSQDSIKTSTSSSHLVEIESSSGKVIIESTIADDFLSEYHSRVKRPIVKQQKLVFKTPESNDILVDFNLLPLDSFTSLSGNSYSLPNGIIIYSKAMNTRLGVIYSFYGGDQASNNKEFFGLTSAHGDWLWYYYGTKQETYLEYGDYDTIVQEYGEKVNDLNDMIKVIP